MHNTEQECWHLQTSSELANARRWAVSKVPWVSRRSPTSLPPSSFLWPEVRFVPILSTLVRISNRLTGLFKLSLSSPYRILGPANPELLNLDPNQDHLYSQIHSLTIRWVTIVTSKHFNSCVAVVTITISTRASALLHKMRFGKRGNELRCSQFLPSIVHKKTGTYS